eukprot:Platyproteum_vivax@DN6118_c0_g1_i2.p1
MSSNFQCVQASHERSVHEDLLPILVLYVHYSAALDNPLIRLTNINPQEFIKFHAEGIKKGVISLIEVYEEYKMFDPKVLIGTKAQVAVKGEQSAATINVYSLTHSPPNPPYTKSFTMAKARFLKTALDRALMGEICDIVFKQMLGRGKINLNSNKFPPIGFSNRLASYSQEFDEPKYSPTKRLYKDYDLITQMAESQRKKMQNSHSSAASSDDPQRQPYRMKSTNVMLEPLEFEGGLPVFTKKVQKERLDFYHNGLLDLNAHPKYQRKPDLKYQM